MILVGRAEAIDFIYTPLLYFYSFSLPPPFFFIFEHILLLSDIDSLTRQGSLSQEVLRSRLDLTCPDDGCHIGHLHSKKVLLSQRSLHSFLHSTPSEETFLKNYPTRKKVISQVDSPRRRGILDVRVFHFTQFYSSKRVLLLVLVLVPTEFGTSASHMPTICLPHATFHRHISHGAQTFLLTIFVVRLVHVRE